MKSLRTAIYARVSTENQDPEMQLSELREYASRRAEVEVIGEFVDIASGTKDDRAQLKRVLDLARQRKLDAVLVWKIDRWGRSLRHLVNTLNELHELGVSFISIRDNLDFSTSAGRLLFHVVGAMAQFERDLICERVRAGQQAAMRRDVRFGRPRVVVDIRTVAKLRAEGLAFAKIAAAIGVSTATVFRAAKGV